jgi:hypothetical protein
MKLVLEVVGVWFLASFLLTGMWCLLCAKRGGRR